LGSDLIVFRDDGVYKIKGADLMTLLQIRQTLLMTQLQFAFALSIRRDSYAKYERGQRAPPEWLMQRARQILAEYGF
jgi:DNA-binding transcriptional regulator YiaG